MHKKKPYHENRAKREISLRIIGNMSINATIRIFSYRRLPQDEKKKRFPFSEQTAENCSCLDTSIQ